MDEIKENTKTANQAWRRKPRKFSPKSRLGCKTCKIRRIKCDLSRPSCLKCQSTGRTCDGYSEMPLAFKNEKTKIESTPYLYEKADRADSCSSYNHCTTISAYHPKKGYTKYHGLIRQNLGPFMILPVIGSAQAGAMWFFEYISINDLNGYRPCESWRKTLIFFSQTVPSVRYAAIALALMHRNYLYRHSSDRMHQSQYPRDWTRDNAPLFHYNRAIRLLLDQESGNSTERTAITLLVCYVFTCFDHLAGNHVQAVKHLRGGVELSRNIDEAILNNNSIYDDSEPSEVRTLIYQVTRQIRRLDMQAVSFLVDWNPVNIQEKFVFQFLPDGTFPSLELAADHLQIVIAQVMRLRHTVQQMSQIDRIPSTLLSLKDIVLGQLETWMSSFKNTLRQGRSYETGSETYPVASLLRLQHTVACILLSCCGPGREMDYDNFLPQFQLCVALAGDLAAAHERYSESLRPTFTPEIGIIPLLYIVGVKCRHPMVRREVLGILRRQPTREAVWDSISAARVVERVIEIEEGGLEEGQMVQNMEQIVACQRIEALSWVHVVSGQSGIRLDISYTFCAREGLHIETLLI